MRCIRTRGEKQDNIRLRALGFGDLGFWVRVEGLFRVWGDCARLHLDPDACNTTAPHIDGGIMPARRIKDRHCTEHFSNILHSLPIETASYRDLLLETGSHGNAQSKIYAL